MPLQWQGKISLLADRNQAMNKPLQDPLKIWLGTLYMLKDIPHPLETQSWNINFKLLNFGLLTVLS